ncbi:nitrogen regulation protein NR(I), partial [Comamonadaceae bacterium OH3737_COT-264]
PHTPPPAPAAPEMLGQASAMQEVFRAIGRLSASHATVLITGESGSGKELVARALHRHSPRAGGPFIAINTAAIPKDLLESELFGHERGAFTGAQALRRGHFEQAEGGTLFLDEIGDMPLELQTRLLRVLSDGHFYRVGGHSPIQARARVIAATHQSLEQRVASGSFRADLFHRLNVIRLRLPPLRERREDIAALAQHFLHTSARQLGVQAKRLSPAALRHLEGFHFPGNVRQLENICHWLTVMAPATAIEAKDLPPEVLHAPPAPETPAPADADADTGNGANASAAWERALHAQAAQLLAQGQPHVWEQLMRRAEAQLLRAALASTQGRRIEAAQRLGIGRNTLTRKLQELGLDGG